MPVIAVATAVEYPWINDLIGNCDNLAIVPSVFTKVKLKKMGFWERVENVLVHYDSVRRFYAMTDESQTESMRKYLSPDMPNIREIEKSIALLLVNSHPTLFGVKPISPVVIPVAGLHVEENDAEFTPVSFTLLLKVIEAFKNALLFKY